jgi:hypothetical protein
LVLGIIHVSIPTIRTTTIATRKSKVPTKSQPLGVRKSFRAILKLIRSKGASVHRESFGIIHKIAPKKAVNLMVLTKHS